MSDTDCTQADRAAIIHAATRRRAELLALVAALRALALYQHDDVSIAADAADAIEQITELGAE